MPIDQHSPLSPAELVLARFRAFREGRFGYIWDSAHPASGFRQAFPERDVYRDYGRKVLASEFEFSECRILDQDVRRGLARVLVWQRFRHCGERQTWFEWVRLRQDEQGWKIFQTARLTGERYEGRLEDFGWEDFEQLSEMDFF